MGRDSLSQMYAITLSPRERLPTDIRILVGAGFVVAIGYGIVAPALPTYARSFDVGVTAATAVVSAFAVFRLAFAPVSGQLIHRMGEVRLFSCGLLVVGLSSAACAFAADYGQLLALRAVGGTGSTMFTVAAASLLIRMSPPKMRARAAAAWATGFLLGNIAGPVVGGVLIEFSVRAPFLIYAVLLGLAAVLIGHRLRGRSIPGGPAEQGAEQVLTFRAAVRHPTFQAALASNFLNGWTVYGVRIALVPLFIVDVVGCSSGWSGAALTAFAAGTAATLLLSGRLADRRGRRLPIVVGSLIVAATMVWLGLSASLIEVLIACGLSGAGTGLMTPPVNAAVADVLVAEGGHARSGPALAGFQMIGDIGAIVGPVLAGFLVEFGGYPGAFALTALIAAASVLCWLRALETAPRAGVPNAV